MVASWSTNTNNKKQTEINKSREKKAIKDYRSNMNYWRMAFREGTRGQDYWDACRNAGIAALGYWMDDDEPVIRDCTHFSEQEFDNIWRDKWPDNASGRSSLRNIACRMQIGDVVYVKQGRFIVGRGLVVSDYNYDDTLRDKNGIPWDHFVYVQWDNKFIPVQILLGAELHTLFLLNVERVTKLDVVIKKSGQPLSAFIFKQTDKSQSILNPLSTTSIPEELPETYREGNAVEVSVNRYERNPQARNACIEKYGYSCSVCYTKPDDIYGSIAKNTIIVHHLQPIASIEKGGVLL